MHMRTLAIAILLLSVSCGGSPGDPPISAQPDPPFVPDSIDAGQPRDAGAQSNNLLTSGSRLRTMRVTGDDGSSEVLSKFFDKDLMLECSFIDTGGESRCLPTAVMSSAYYTDPQCSAPMFFDAACGKPLEHIVFVHPEFGAPPNYRACRGPIKVFKIAAILWSSRPTTLYVWDGMTCTQQRVTQALTQRFYNVVEELPLTSFARGSKPTVD